MASVSPLSSVSSSKPKPHGLRFFWRHLLVIVLVAIVADLALVNLIKDKKKDALPVLPLFANAASLTNAQSLANALPTDPQAQLTLGQEYLKHKHYLSALATFEQAGRLKADEYKILTGQAKAYIALENTPLALKTMQRMQKLQPRNINTILTLAEVQQHTDDWRGAKQTLDSVPRDADGLPQGEGDRIVNTSLLSTAYSHIDAWADAEKLVRTVAKVAPENKDARIMLGKILHATGKYTEAIPYLIEAVDIAPKSDELAYLLGNAFEKRGQKDDDKRALICFQGAVGLNDKHGPAALALARAAEKQKDWKMAAFFFRHAHELGMEGGRGLLHAADNLVKANNVEESWYYRGLYFELFNQPELAIKEYAKLTGTHQYCRSGYLHSARAYSHMKQPEKTLECLKKAQKLNPEQAKELDWSFVSTYGEMKIDKPAVVLLEKMIAENRPDKDEAHFSLAKIATGNGKFDEGLKQMEQCVALKPKDAGYRRELGKLYLDRRGDKAALKKAIEQLETAVRLMPEDVGALFELGRAYSYVERWEDAVLTLRHTVDLNPEQGNSYQVLGQALIKIGRKEEGAAMLALFRRYQEFQGTRERLSARCKRAPKDFEAHRQMANFHMTAHEYPAAITYFSRCLELQPNNTQVRRNLIIAQGLMGQRENQKLQLDILAKQTSNGRNGTVQSER